LSSSKRKINSYLNTDNKNNKAVSTFNLAEALAGLSKTLLHAAIKSTALHSSLYEKKTHLPPLEKFD
jgi:hypothetical protein